MSFSILAGTAAAIGSAVGNAGSSVMDRGLGYYFGGKSEERSNRRSEALTGRQMARQFEFDMAGMNRQYELSKAAYDYSNAEQYRLSRQYAENSASWNVEGLRRAGLNPILAATDGNFRSTYGDVGQMGFSGASGFGSSGQFKSAGGVFPGHGSIQTFSDALRDVSSARESAISADRMEQTTPSFVQSAKASADLTEAQAIKTRAEAGQIAADTMLSSVRAANETRHEGLHGFYGAIQNGIHHTSEMLGRFINFVRSRSLENEGETIELLDHSAKDFPDKVRMLNRELSPREWQQIEDELRSMGNQSSAKDVEFHRKKLDEWERDRRLIEKFNKIH